jgi:hypothetical protein
MKNSFNVTLNEQIIYSYTEQPAPARLRRYLDEMESHMESGIALGEQHIEQPSDFQKLQYVAMQLFNALDKKDANMAEVMSAYLLNRNVDLREICVTLMDDVINLKLI